jgi:hypothetical protein
MADCEVIAGHHGHVYMIDEVTPGVTPNASAWDWLGEVVDLTPTFVPNEVKVTGVGSRRYLERIDGDFQAGFRATLRPRNQKSLLDWLTMVMGSATGTVDTGLPTKSLEVWQARADPAWFLANLYNMVKARSVALNWQYGQPLQLSLDMACQAIQASSVSGGSPDYLTQYDAFQDIDVGSRGAAPAYGVKPYSFMDVPRPQIDYGSGLEDLPSIDNWTLTTANVIQLVPGAVEGADSLWYPWPECLAEEGQEISMNFNITPATLGIYKKWLERSHLIDELRVIINHPTGSGSLASTTLKMLNGGWDLGDYSLRELVLSKQPLTATFQSIIRIDTSP